MEKGKTYVITCKRGIIKTECPLITQEKGHCVDCAYALYWPRSFQYSEDTSTTSEKTEQKQNE